MRKGEFTGAHKQCSCGRVFYVRKSLLESGRKKYCSKSCMYRFMKRPSGLKYDCKVVNPTWFVHSSRASPMYVPPKGTRSSPATEFKKGMVPANFAGDDVGYVGLHTWVRSRLGKATKCSQCGKSHDRIHWANISQEYKRDLSDWMQLCPSCHIAYDKRTGGWGAAKAKFGDRRR